MVLKIGNGSMSCHHFQRVRSRIQGTACFAAWAALFMAAYATTPAEAVLIATDSFATTAGGADYAVGGLAGQNPTVGLSGFTGAWNTGTAAFVLANGGFTHPLSIGIPLPGQINAFSSAGTNPRNLSRAINYVPTDGTYYASVLLNKSAANNTLDLFAGLGPLQSVSAGFTSVVSASIGFFNGGLGFLSNGTVTTLLSDAQVNVGETYLGLLRFDYSTTGADTVTASIYNGSSALVANQVFSGLNLDGNLGRFIVVTNNFDTTVSLDEWRFGTQLSDVVVVPPAPEPATCTLLAMGIVAVAMKRRRDRQVATVS
jgi:hypothetical protein